MTSITLRNVPQELHRALKSEAERHGRSLQKEVLSMLQDHVQMKAVDVEELIERAAKVRESQAIYVTQKELEAFKREGRE